MAYAYVGPGGRRPFPMPAPVTAARTVLWVQASIWAVVDAASWCFGAMDLLAYGGLGKAHHVAFWGAWIGPVTFFTLGSLGLALGLRPGKNGVRWAVIGLEIFMTCFGTAVAFVFRKAVYWPPLWPVLLAAFIGAVVSCASVIWLLSRQAREYARAMPTYQ